MVIRNKYGMCSNGWDSNIRNKYGMCTNGSDSNFVTRGFFRNPWKFTTRGINIFLQKTEKWGQETKYFLGRMLSAGTIYFFSLFLTCFGFPKSQSALLLANVLIKKKICLIGFFVLEETSMIEK